jgi:hypothetical protein
MEKKSFENWTYEDIQDVFGMVKLSKMPLLEDWQKATHQPDASRKVVLDDLRSDLIEYANAWNEDELKMCFISPLIALVHYRSADYKVFTQRNLSGTFPELGWELNGRIEWLISKGILKPKMPFFFLHEYKQENRIDSDPLGQLLSAMVVAQLHNQSEMPLYGCYVVGRLWYFTVMLGRQYAVSLAYDATKEDDLLAIFAILSEVKVVIARALERN